MNLWVLATSYTGCLPEDILNMRCAQQPIFAYEYILDEDGNETMDYEFVTSRDCFCDMRCQGKFELATVLGQVHKTTVSVFSR